MKKKKDIVILCGPSLRAVSGVSTHLNQLLNSELGAKYSLIHFQVGSEGRSESLAGKLGRLLIDPLKFALLIRKRKPAIIHLNSSLEKKAYWRDLSYLLVAWFTRVPVVYQIHGGEFPQKFLGKSEFAKAFLRWSLKLPAAIVLLANIEREKYLQFGNFRRLKTIPNAVDLLEYEGQKPKSFDRKCLKLGYIGRLADDKGVKETLLAIADLPIAERRDVRFSIAGSGPFESDLRRIVKAKNIEDMVHFVGVVSGIDKPLFWQDIDVFVFPTFHREGLPYAVLEALASATPMITTPVGGIPDIVIDGEHGVMVPIHDVSAISLAIRHLYWNREELVKMSQSAAEQARQKCGISRLAGELNSLYREIIVES